MFDTSRFALTVVDGSARLSGTLDVYTAPELRDALSHQVQPGGRSEIDLAGVESCDLAGLQLLASARKSAAQAGGAMVFREVSEAVREALSAHGLPVEAITGTEAGEQ